MSNAPQVVRVAQRKCAHAELFGAFNAHEHGLLARDLAITALSVQAEHGAGVEQNFDAGVGLQTAFEHRIDVARRHAHAM